MKKRLIAALLFALSATPSVAQDGPLSVWFDKSPSEVGEIIANFCLNQNSAIVSQDMMHVECSKEAKGFGGMLAQALVGNSYSTTPEIHARFAIVGSGKVVRVSVQQWLETQMAMGQIRKMPLNGRSYNDHLRQGLVKVGALTEAPAPPPPPINPPPVP